MAEILIRSDKSQLVKEKLIPKKRKERLLLFTQLHELLSKLYQVRYKVPENDISSIASEFEAFGITEKLQINTWWTPTENWPVERMLEVGSLQIALAIHLLKLPPSEVVSSTIEQKGVDPRLNKTIFVVGYRDDHGNICVQQESPVMAADSQQVIEDNKPKYETVLVEYKPEEIKELLQQLGAG